MSAEAIGIIMSGFALAMSALIYWGGFVEQRRANDDAAATFRKA